MNVSTIFSNFLGQIVLHHFSLQNQRALASMVAIASAFVDILYGSGKDKHLSIYAASRLSRLGIHLQRPRLFKYGFSQAIADIFLVESRIQANDLFTL